MGHCPADTGRGHGPGGLECRQGDRTATTTSERTTSSNTGGMDRRRAERNAATDRPSGTAAHEPCPRRCHRARDPGAAGAGTPADEKHRRRCLLGLRCSRQRIRTELQDGRGRLGAVQTVGRGRDTAAGSGMAWPVLTNPPSYAGCLFGSRQLRSTRSCCTRVERVTRGQCSGSPSAASESARSAARAGQRSIASCQTWRLGGSSHAGRGTPGMAAADCRTPTTWTRLETGEHVSPPCDNPRSECDNPRSECDNPRSECDTVRGSGTALATGSATAEHDSQQHKVQHAQPPPASAGGAARTDDQPATGGVRGVPSEKQIGKLCALRRAAAKAEGVEDRDELQARVDEPGIRAMSEPAVRREIAQRVRGQEATPSPPTPRCETCGEVSCSCEADIAAQMAADLERYRALRDDDGPWECNGLDGESNTGEGCGARYSDWVGRCAECERWNNIFERTVGSDHDNTGDCR